MNETGLPRILPDQSSGSALTFATLRHTSVSDPIPSKRVCFYKSGDPQFNGLRLVINNRTFKTFDALLDSLSKKVPLPFGVRNITTPHGVHVINTLDELEDGKSYICSDSRKVKPINLALARKKLPPWYHARPVSSRRRTVQQARFFPGRSIHKPTPVLVRTPKRLLVFRNGDPTVKHTVVLHKKNAPSYESILEYISELMQFHVVKLYTPDGKRVDGLPGLILCAGTVVAAGRESFRPALYNSQKSPPAPRLHNKRQKFLYRKKKSLSNSSKLRNFSPSSERYVVHQIHNSMSYGGPSNPTNSIELDSNRILESVAETEGETVLGDGGEGQYCSLPSEDDIEKSFRVNQDGSMTVEMKVRLTIKEQETVHWTTTLSRSCVDSCLPEPIEEICSTESNLLDLQNSTASSIDSTREDQTKESDPLSLVSALNGSSHEEADFKSHPDEMFPRRFPTPGPKQISKKQTSIESTKSVTANGIQEELVGSYSYREQTENGEMTEQYCVVKQSSRPVPKPRRLGSVECSGSYLSGLKSAGTSEVFNVESSGEEVTETVLHIYEQQTCQDNYLANICAPRMSPPKTKFDRPTTSETAKLSCNNEFEPELCRPSTASESISIWKAESTSATSDLNANILKKQRQLQKPAKSQVKTFPGEASNDKKASTKHKVKKKHVRWTRTPEKRQKKNSAEAAESKIKPKTFSSAQFLKAIYGSKSKSTKSKKNLKKRTTQNGNGSVTTNSLSEDTIKSRGNDPKASKNIRREKVSFQTGSFSSPEVSHPRGTLTRQTSMHMEKKRESNSHDTNASVQLPPSNCASSSMNEYVENWLEKAHLHQQAENTRCNESRNKQGFIAEAEHCNVEKSKLETCQTSGSRAENIASTSVKLKIQSFENKSESQNSEKTVSENILHNSTTHLNQNYNKDPNTEHSKPLLNGLSSEVTPPISNIATGKPLQSKRENQSNSVKISFQEASPSNSMELPPPPSAAEIAELTNEAFTKHASAVSSPLYRLSSSSSPKTLSTSPSSGEVVSAENASIQTETPLTRSPSVKRAPLVSNLSLERKMSLRKASMEKHTLGSDSPKNMDATSTGDAVQINGVCSLETQEQIRTLPEDAHHSFRRISGGSRYSSVSPSSLTSDERVSSASISSSEASVPLPSKETQKASSSHKTSVKNVKLASSPSPERKHLKKKSLEVPSNSPMINNPSARHANSNANRSTERKQKLYKAKQQKRLSPYSQSLDVVSPLIRGRSGNKLLQRNLSLERKGSTARKNKSSGKTNLDKTDRLLLPQKADTKESIGNNKNVDNSNIGNAKPLNSLNQPNMKPVLDQICYSIKSIRQMTQSKRPSCLEKSNSLPDFSSHVASTFGSSSKALLAFLSVMTLKDGISNRNVDELNANNVSCAEALKMIDSLAEIANIEDSHKLKSSLSDLQHSASKQLLQSWKGFQELRCKSHSSTSTSAEQELLSADSPDQEENVIDDLLDDFDIPEKLKEELVSLSEGQNSSIEARMSKKSEQVESNNDEDTNHPANDCVASGFQSDQANANVRSIIEKFTHVNQAKETSLKSETSSSTQEENSENIQSCHNVVYSGELSNCKSGLDEIVPKTQTAKETLKESCDRRASTPHTEDGGIFLEAEVPGETESHSEDDEDNEPSHSYYVELNAREEKNLSRSDSENQDLSEEEQPKVEYNSSETETPKLSIGVNVSLEESTDNSEVDETLSEEDQPSVQSKQLQVIVEETLSGIEEEEEEEEVEHVYVPQPDRDQARINRLEALPEEAEEDNVSSEEAEKSISETTQSKEWSTLKDKRFIANDDSGNDHGSCEEDQARHEDEHLSGSLEEELSCYYKESSSEEEKANLCQDGLTIEALSDVINCEIALEKDTPTQSVAERVILLERQVANSQRRKYSTRSSADRGHLRRNAPDDDDDDDDSSSESPTSQMDLCTRSAPQSSLSFSYDSSGVITTEPEGNRVRSIREMFLAKSATDIQHNRVPSSSASERLDSVSGGYQSQTSSEPSSGEDDSARKSITKGFVRRTIERLYGKKDVQPDEELGERPPSVEKQKTREPSSLFSSLQTARSKAMSELSYFNSTNALDTLTEATRCIAFNAQVGPGDSVPIDNGRWLLRENTLIRKSISDPVSINKSFTNAPERDEVCKDTENTPYSQFSTKSELEDKAKSFSRKCTYFSLPHGSDSDACLDETTKGCPDGDSAVEVKEVSEDAKTRAEKNGKLPGVGEFRIGDNKVHPLTENPPDAEVVVVQPGKGQGVVNRRLQEPDMLDFLYNFCGQNCPIL